MIDFSKEPRTYTELAEALSKSNEEYHKKILEKGIDSHSQIKDAAFFSKRIELFIKNFFNLEKTIIMDCGCGLGFIARELEKCKSFVVYYSDPSTSVKKIIETIYPSKNFFSGDIEKIPEKFDDCFDVIYLREVYPFTRTNEITLHSSLIKILNKKLKKNGILIFEQIKNPRDIFNNLKKLQLDYQIFYLPPVRWLNFQWFYRIYFNFNFFSFFVKILYKLFNKKISHYLVIKKAT